MTTCSQCSTRRSGELDARVRRLDNGRDVAGRQAARRNIEEGSYGWPMREAASPSQVIEILITVVYLVGKSNRHVNLAGNGSKTALTATRLAKAESTARFR